MTTAGMASDWFCVRCGCTVAQGAPLSGCTEKRGTQPPWVHDYHDPGSRPFRDMSFEDLRDSIAYFAMKSTGSVAMVNALARTPGRAGEYARALYREKADKRTRMLDMHVEEMVLRLTEGDKA